MPCPTGTISARWVVAGVALIVEGMFALRIGMLVHGVDRRLLVVVAAGGAVVVGALVLMGKRQAWVPALVAMSAAMVGVGVITWQVLRLEPGSEAEDMRPIIAMGGLTGIAFAMVPLVLLATCRRPRRGVPPGWRVDPLSASRLRLWDGSRWTEHIAPVRPVGGVVPGWYPDPVDEERLQYWDGWCWTGHTAPTHWRAEP